MNSTPGYLFHNGTGQVHYRIDGTDIGGTGTVPQSFVMDTVSCFYAWLVDHAEGN